MRTLIPGSLTFTEVAASLSVGCWAIAGAKKRALDAASDKSARLISLEGPGKLALSCHTGSGSPYKYGGR